MQSGQNPSGLAAEGGAVGAEVALPAGGRCHWSLSHQLHWQVYLQMGGVQWLGTVLVRSLHRTRLGRHRVWPVRRADHDPQLAHREPVRVRRTAKNPTADRFNVGFPLFLLYFSSKLAARRGSTFLFVELVSKKKISYPDEMWRYSLFYNINCCL